MQVLKEMCISVLASAENSEWQQCNHCQVDMYRSVFDEHPPKPIYHQESCPARRANMILVMEFNMPNQLEFQ